ncbi:GH3 auxin-responsive promoter family protein [Streptomyces sp. NPDC017988]|uniref:GH3 auxin-responsive promoter family protein n=1 Tax=Streptomyces sp. NPDC017988 TaxID=3365025 RepID=UPI0037A97616
MRPTDTAPRVQSDQDAAWRARLVAAKDRFAAALPDAAARQRRILAEILTDNADTAFGREHGFARLRTIDDYRAAVPLRTHQEYRPWLTRSAAGEARVLTAEPPKLFFTTSGSTGDRKRVPVTESFVRRVYLPFFQAAMGVPAQYHPDAFGRGAVTLNLRHDRLARPALSDSGRPSLGPSQADLRGGFGVDLEEPGSRAPWAELPAALDDQAYLDKLYVRVRTAAEHDVRSVIGHNPTMIAMLPELIAQWWPRLIEDIRDGTCLGAPGGTPAPARAAELERRAGGRPTPAAIWPHLSLLYCWTSGVASLYLPRLKDAYGPSVTVLPTPPAASEGPVGVPVDQHPSAGPLAVSCVLYEFVDASRDVAPDSPTLLHDELEEGRDYHVVLSHLGGLYRYVLGDLAHVVDHVEGVPRVEYAGRATLSDTVGERLREPHVVRALREASRVAGIGVANVTCRPENGPGRPHHTLVVAPDQPLPPARLPAFQDLVDKELCRVSHDYRHVRSTGALGAARVVPVAASAFTEHWHHRLAAGMRPPEIKDQVFQHDPAAWARLRDHGRHSTHTEKRPE